jgi:hypothetical protein
MGAVFENVVKLKKAATGVVKDAIEDDFDLAIVSGVDEFAKGDVSAQQWIDLVVIVGVIAVITRRLENGREVNRSDAQVLQVGKFVDYAPEVAAFVAFVGGRRIPGFQGDRGLGERITRIGSTGKAIGKNLIKDRVFDPVWRLDWCLD